LDLGFVFAEKKLLVVCLTYSYAECNRNRIACAMLVPDPEWIWIENSQNRVEAGRQKVLILSGSSATSTRPKDRDWDDWAP